MAPHAYTAAYVARVSARVSNLRQADAPAADITSALQDLIEAQAGYRLAKLRDKYPGVTLTDEQAARLVAVLR